MKRAILAAAMLCMLSLPAEARRMYSQHRQATSARYHLYHHHIRATHSDSTVIGGRPSGCPTQFCGCGASLHLFGRIIPSLNLASNWFRFPRSAPAPRMAAVRSHHVFVLEQHIGGDIWLVHDSNSGGRATRLHQRSIAGYTIVNPSGAS